MTATNTYRNPILPGFNPDPSICYVPGKGYFVSTSTFEFFPGLPIYHSTDLVDWKLIGHALNRRSQGVDMRTVETSAGLWAPTFRYHGGKWYMICSCFWRLRISPDGKPDVISSGFYVTTDDIFDDSKWSEAVYFDQIGFDQDLLFDDDGRVYQTVTRFNWEAPPIHGNPRIESFINEIDLATGQSLTEPVLAKASSLGVAEGCHIIKKDGYYYFFTAEGGTQDGHRECVYRSTSPTGPFQPPPAGINPLIYNADHPDIQNTGHMDLIPNENGQWIAVFLGVRPVFEAKPDGDVGGKGMPTHLGRETFMALVEWIDGWPVVNQGRPIELVGHGKGLTYVAEERLWEDQFVGNELQLGWYNVRVPFRPCYSLTDRPGYLGIRGSATTLDMEHNPAVLLRKQTAYDLDWSTELEFVPTRPGQEAGTIVWLSARSHAAIGIRGVEGGNVEIVYRVPDENKKIQERAISSAIAPGTSIQLLIRARRQSYELLYRLPDQSEYKSVASVPTDTFVPLFTGVHLGLYAQGSNNTPCMNNAYFKSAKYELTSV